MAFMQSEIFNDQDRNEWPLFLSVEDTRKQFSKNTKVMVAIGGWGNEDGFREAARSGKGRQKWAEGVRRMVEKTGADGTYTVLPIQLRAHRLTLLQASISIGSIQGKSFLAHDPPYLPA
jgi:hypothetical protein